MLLPEAVFCSLRRFHAVDATSVGHIFVIDALLAGNSSNEPDETPTATIRQPVRRRYAPRSRENASKAPSLVCFRHLSHDLFSNQFSDRLSATRSGASMLQSDFIRCPKQRRRRDDAIVAERVGLRSRTIRFQHRLSQTSAIRTGHVSCRR